MPKGKVVWFNSAKGYGFLRGENGGDDIFVHFSALNMDGYKELKADQVVEFEVVPGAKGPQAENVTVVDKAVSRTAQM
jgi:CspA family cold shock protein